MLVTQTFNFTDRQWRMLLIYHLYRLVSIIALFGLYWFEAYGRVNSLDYNFALLLYFLSGLLFLFFAYKGPIPFETQILWLGTIDVVAMVLFIDAIGYLQSGLGIMLYVTIAMLSILVPGKLAIYFASIGSCMLLLISFSRYEYGAQHDLTSFFNMGFYGAGFFATALTTWYLAHWIRINEQLAERRGNELLSILRVGEYFVEQIKLGVIYVDAEGNIQLINGSACRYLSMSKCELPLSLEMISKQLFVYYQNFLLKQKKKKEYAQFFFTQPNLRVQLFSATIALKTSVLILLEDMSEIEQQAQQFKLASLGRFSASIAHELRNPLAVISHAIQLLGESTQLNEEDSHLKELIENNCNRMNRVIKNVLQISRRSPMKTETIELSSFLREFKHQFCMINNCELTINIQPNIKPTVFFDRGQFDQILVILCDNAMQHGRDPEGAVKIVFSVTEHEGRLRLSICDSGPGIPWDKRNMVFEPFFTTLITGNGMGLFIAKDLCEINRAHLVLEEVEQGCCFSIRFNSFDEISL